MDVNTINLGHVQKQVPYSILVCLKFFSNCQLVVHGYLLICQVQFCSQKIFYVHYNNITTTSMIQQLTLMQYQVIASPHRRICHHCDFLLTCCIFHKFTTRVFRFSEIFIICKNEHQLNYKKPITSALAIPPRRPHHLRVLQPVA